MSTSNSAATVAVLRRAAFATAVVFFASGAMFGTWASRLPTLRRQLEASEPELGLALLGLSIGSVIAMPMTGRLTARFGSSQVVITGAVIAATLLIVLPHLPTVAALGAVLVGWGAAYGTWDVAMNVHGSAVERQAGRVWMPRYHAMWSAGGIFGSGLGALVAWAGLAVSVHFAIASVLLVAIVLVALRHFVPDRATDLAPPSTSAGIAATEPADSAPHDRSGSAGGGVVPYRQRRIWSRRILAIGLITFAATLIEGAAGDWLAIYLADVRGAATGPAAAGYTAFAAAMALIRFAGTPIVARFGRAGTARLAGALSAVGVAATLTVPGLAGAYGGALLWGAGVAILFPLAMSAAGDSPHRPADAIAAVSTIGYCGFLVGPPLIGFLAGIVGLGSALWLLLALSLVALVLAPVLGAAAGGGPRR